MPWCELCNRKDTSGELRRMPKLDDQGERRWRCKDRDGCKFRKRRREESRREVQQILHGGGSKTQATVEERREAP